MIEATDLTKVMRDASRTAVLFIPFAAVFSVIYAVVDAWRYAYGLEGVQFVEEVGFNIPGAVALSVVLTALAWTIAGLYYAVEAGGESE